VKCPCSHESRPNYEPECATDVKEIQILMYCSRFQMPYFICYVMLRAFETETVVQTPGTGEGTELGYKCPQYCVSLNIFADITILQLPGLSFLFTKPSSSRNDKRYTWRLRYWQKVQYSGNCTANNWQQ
jgi:hypothetical protein